MPDIALPVSSLAHLMRQGRFGRTMPEGPGVTLSTVHPCEIVSVIAAKGKASALAAALKKDFGIALPGMGQSASARGLTMVGVQPDSWLAVQPGGANLAGRLEDKAGKLAMITADQVENLAGISEWPVMENEGGLLLNSTLGGHCGYGDS